MIRFCFPFVTAVLIGLAGCIAPPQSIDALPLQHLTALDSRQLYAGTDDGRLIAYVKGGLYLLNLDSGVRAAVAEQSPLQLAWHPDGSVLAAAFRIQTYETLLQQYNPDGRLIHEVTLPIATSQLAWSLRGDLLVTGYEVTLYSFGGNVRQSLYRVNGPDLDIVELSDATLKPRTAKLLSEAMSDVLPVIFSTYGDEFFYVRLHDPPEFPPYLNILSMNWQAGKPQTLLELPLQEVELKRGRVEDTAEVLLQTGKYLVKPWSQDSAPTSPYHFDAGRLYDGEQVLMDWGQDSKMQFLSDGRFLLATQNHLYLGRGLRPAEREVYSEKIWTLRRWRASGLVSPVEYQALLDKESS